MSTIFISYAREDAEKAEQLAWELEARGASVWWDQEILSGERYIDAILRKINQADAVVLLLSDHSAASTWVAFEAGAARSREESSGREILKIAQVGPCEIPGFVGERHCTDWQGHDGLTNILLSLSLPAEMDYKPHSGQAETHLQIFRTGGQWMELVGNHQGMACLLVDAGEQRAQIQWRIDAEAVAWLAEDPDGHIKIGAPRPDRSWSLVRIADQGRWRWTPELFSGRDGLAPEEAFKKALVEHLRETVALV